VGKFVGKNSRAATILSLGSYEPKNAPLTLQMYTRYPSLLRGDQFTDKCNGDVTPLIPQAMKRATDVKESGAGLR
jgi:hypothetical protein